MSDVYDRILKVNEIIELADIPRNWGEQFINVYWQISANNESGMICYGFKHKLEMGEIYFKSFDEAIAILEVLNQRANKNDITKEKK